VENNKQLIVRFFEEVWNQRKLEIADDIFDNDCHTFQLQSGTPATTSIRMMTLHRIQRGKIIEDWVIVESLGFLQQLGIISATSDLLREFRERKD
jgi:hypothetical protein